VLWSGWLLAHEGARAVTDARFGIGGHYTREGHTLLQDADGWTRPVRAARVVVGWGFGAVGAPWSWMAALALGAACLAGARRAWPAADRRGVALLAGWLVPYLANAMVNHDVGYPRYSLPVVAGAILLVANALPRGPRPAALAASAIVAGMALAAWPLARLHAVSPRLGDAAATWLARHARGETLLIATGDAYLPFHLRAHRVDFRVPGPGTEGLALATFAAADAPGAWQPVARFCRGPRIETRGPREVWLFRTRESQGGTFDVPPCSVAP
jgi:hypothetical protein